MEKERKVTGIILAGGKSLRMGHEKGLAMLRGKTLIEHAIAILKPCCNDILISANTTAYDHLGLQVIPDLVKNIGPMGGLFSGLKACHTDQNLVLSCDMPFVETGLMEYLLEHAKNSLAAIPWYGKDHYEPMCAYYHHDFARILEGYIESGNYKLPDVFSAHPVESIPIDKDWGFYSEWLFYNVNTMEQLREAEKRLIS